MYELNISSCEMWDESKEQFVFIKEQSYMLEHSLIAISKWEMKFKKPFMTRDNKSDYEWKYYITKCMVIGKNIPDYVYNSLSMDTLNSIFSYMKDPMTASSINENGNKKSRNSEETTSELIYAWMALLHIPFEPTERWHINRILTLIRIVDIKSKPSKKKSTREILSENAKLNAERRKKYNSKG